MQKSRIDIQTELSRLPMFQALSAEQLEALAKAARERLLAKGEMLFQRGDEARGFFMVVQGQMKLALSSPQGHEKVVEILGPLQSFGEAVMFLGRPYPVFAQALTESRLIHIGQAEVFALLETDPSFARRMLAGLSMRLHGLVQDVEAYSLRSSAERVIGYLLQHGQPDAGGNHVVTLPVSKQVVASLLNLTPETLSRIFHELATHGLIQVEGRQVLIADTRRLALHHP